MKKTSEVFICMVYPMLISFFLFCFVTAFVEDGLLELLQVISAMLAFVFGVLFIIGLICNIVNSIKNRNN